LAQVVQALPEHRVDFAQAATPWRAGVLKLAQRLLESWGHVADLQRPRPCCPQGGVAMRHRGLPETGVMPTVGVVD
jgi:hypothetical protein